jgi:hypothetical protein
MAVFFFACMNEKDFKLQFNGEFKNAKFKMQNAK